MKTPKDTLVVLLMMVVFLPVLALAPFTDGATDDEKREVYK